MKTRTLLSTVLVSSVVAALSISASAQAGTVTPGGDASTGSDLRCSTGGIGATLPVATSNTTGLVWQITSIQFWNGSVFVHYAWSNYRKAPVTAGGSTQLSWVDANTGAYVYGLESYSVPVGAYYRLVQYVYVDGGWIYRIPIAPGPGGIGWNSYCFS